VIVYGRNPVREALRGPRAVHRVWATDRAAEEPWLAGIDTAPAGAHEIESRCGSAEHQGICAAVEEYRYADPDGLLADDEALVICLDEVQDPHNVGAVCRVTDAACKASAGAVEHLAVARVRNLADWLTEAKQAGAWVYGAAAEARTPWDRPDYNGRVVLVLGSEGRGLRPRVTAVCDEAIALPTRGRVASLNVSTAAAGLVYTILHLRNRA